MNGIRALVGVLPAMTILAVGACLGWVEPAAASGCGCSYIGACPPSCSGCAPTNCSVYCPGCGLSGCNCNQLCEKASCPSGKGCGNCGGTCPRNGQCSWCASGGSSQCGGTASRCKGVACASACPGPPAGMAKPAGCTFCPTRTGSDVCGKGSCVACLANVLGQAEACPAPGGTPCSDYCSGYGQCPRGLTGSCPGPDATRNDCLCHCGGAINAAGTVCDGTLPSGAACGINNGVSGHYCDGAPASTCCLGCNYFGPGWGRLFGYDCMGFSCKSHCNDHANICSVAIACSCANNGQSDPCDLTTIPNSCKECTGVQGSLSCPSQRQCNAIDSW